MYLKTPLRYPGGKSRAVKKMAPYFPDFNNYKEFREPFLGGGSVALYVSQMYPHLDIWVNDLYTPLATFWKVLQTEGIELYNELVQLKTRHPDPASARGLFNDAKDYLAQGKKEDFHIAVSFYIINKCSFSGLSESSSFSPQASDSNFSMRGIEKLRFYEQVIQKWSITHLSYVHMMPNSKEVFTYLDPSYEIKSKLYGKSGSMHKGFDHDEFAHACNTCIGDQMVSYNSSNLIKDRFHGWNAHEYDHTYTMRSVGDYMTDQQQRKELVLTNYGIR